MVANLLPESRQKSWNLPYCDGIFACSSALAQRWIYDCIACLDVVTFVDVVGEREGVKQQESRGLRLRSRMERGRRGWRNEKLGRIPVGIWFVDVGLVE